MQIGERIKNVIRGMGSILNPDPLPEPEWGKPDWSEPPTNDAQSTTTGSAMAVTDLTQEMDGIPADFIQAMEEADRGDLIDLDEALDERLDG